MRQHLYHGKRVDNGEWVEGWLQPFTNGGYIGLDDRLCIVNGMYPKDIYEVIPETVGEWTGLTDKNDKKIFEGHILKIYSTVKAKSGFLSEQRNEKREDFAVVLYDYHTGGYRLKVYHKGKYKRISKFTAGHLSIYDAEVIGNIHDNPELLEGV